MPGATGVPTEVDVVIVGAGFAGICMGIRLARRNRESFLILERAGQVGGTWRDNRYPGVACDVPAHLYSFSFHPKPDWSRKFAAGSEIQDYLLGCVRDEGLLPHLRLDTEMRDARWDEACGRWQVSTTTGDYSARTLVMAAGRLSEPRIPDIDGLSGFDGPVFHSSQWPDGIDLTGRRVGVVGTGASAIQMVPRLAAAGSDVVVFQRTPAYVVPRGDRDFSEDERALFRHDPTSTDRMRDRLFREMERGIAQRHRVHPDIDQLRDRALGHLHAQVHDPALRALLTPDYEIGCKRVLLSDDFYPALAGGGARLEPSALASVSGSTAVAARGARHRLDVLVLATGFLSTRPPFARRITGRADLSLSAKWADGMVSHASTVVHGFPNMYVLDGPNATLGHNSAIYMIESQVEYVLGALDFLATRRPAALAVTAQAEREYTRTIDELSRSSVWITGGCSSWYVDETSGRLTLLWPDSAVSFRERNGTFDATAYEGAPSAV